MTSAPTVRPPRAPAGVRAVACRAVACRVAGLAVAGLAALPGAGAAQEPSGGLPGPGAALEAPRALAGARAAARIDALYDALDPGASLAAAAARLEAEPDDWDALWRAARAAVVLGTLADEEDEQDAWFLRGAAYGERAVALRPEAVDGLYWLAAAKGRLALQQGPRTTAALAQEVYDLAHRVLAQDSLHAGGHDILGKLYYEVMTLTTVERFLARLILGNEALRVASWERAERHFALSVRSAPEVILFRYDLARMYLARDRLDDARDALEGVLALPVRHPPDPGWQREARDLLSGLDAMGSR